MGAGGRVTSADVARRAGVSRATVSYVLNEVPSQTFSEPTRARVRAAAAALGYVPNPAARALRVGRTSTVLLPLPGVHLSPRWAGIVEHGARALAERGNTLVADFTSYGSPEALVEAGMRLQPAVVIDPMVVDRELMTLFAARGARVLTSPRTRPAGGVEAPALHARTLQVDHLLARGCRRVVSLTVLGNDTDPRQAPALDELLDERCRRAGARYEVWPVEADDPTHLRSRVATLRRQSGTDRAHGLCAVNDHLATAALTACLAGGLGVPDDVAIIGLDAHPLGAALTPTLTTVAWDLATFGERLADAVDVLLRDGEATLGIDAIEYRVLQRESA